MDQTARSTLSSMTRRKFLSRAACGAMATCCAAPYIVPSSVLGANAPSNRINVGVKAVRQHKRVLQTGSMYRSSPAARLACELVRNGRIGQVNRVLTEVAENNAESPGPDWKPMPVPEGFDYDTWLGPAPDAPYHAEFH